MSLIDLAEARNENLYGGKATDLGAALRAGLPVPPGIAASFEFVEHMVTDRGRRPQLIGWVEELDAPYVVRSSGIGEDSEQASFAGQHRSVINVDDAEGVIDAFEEVHASAHSEAAMEYRSALDLDESPKMGVVVQTMVDAEKSGVLFSRNPLDGSDERVIEASWGLGVAVVDSIVPPDYFRVHPGGEVLERRAGTKDARVTPVPGGGTQMESVPAGKQERLCLNDEELRALDDLAERCESYRDGGHDIEWAFTDGDLYLLQRRDITTK